MVTNPLIPKKIPFKFRHNLVQPKLEVNSPGDIYEKEADAMADRVMQMSDIGTTFQTSTTTGLIGQSVQRKCSKCVEEEKKKSVMRRAENGSAGTPVSSSFASSLNASKGGGAPLPSDTRNFMENAFSADFSSVRVHTGSPASEMSNRIKAKAFTYGSDIYFNDGKYNPGTSEGKHLLAHEMTHVVQQIGRDDLSIQRTIGDGHDLSSPRFKNDPVLEEIYDGNTQLSEGAIGDAVTKIQHALQDLGIFLRNFGVDGIYEQETRRGVSTYQNQKHITADPRGTVAVETISSLDNDFLAVTDSPANLSQNPASMACLLALLCPWNRALVADFRNANFRIILVDRLFWADEMFDGTSWQPNPMEGAGETENSVLRIRKMDTCDVVAQTIYHEHQHARSPRRLRTQPWADEETNAYTLETSWSISRGLSPNPSLVTTNPLTGVTSVNTAGISSQVATYPGMVAGSTDEVIAKVGSSRVRVRQSDGRVVIRAAVAGDSIPGPRRVTNPQSIKAREWICA